MISQAPQIHPTAHHANRQLTQAETKHLLSLEVENRHGSDDAQERKHLDHGQTQQRSAKSGVISIGISADTVQESAEH